MLLPSLRRGIRVSQFVHTFIACVPFRRATLFAKSTAAAVHATEGQKNAANTSGIFIRSGHHCTAEFVTQGKREEGALARGMRHPREFEVGQRP